MTDPLKELERRFNKILEPEDESREPYTLPKAPQAIKEYLLFVEETSPFNTIAREMREKYPSTSTMLLEKIRTGAVGVVDMSMARPFARSLHLHLVEELKKQIRAGRKGLVFYEKGGRVCLVGNETRCYPTRAEAPQRFEIVKILLRTRSGKSASEIAQMLGKNLAQKNKSVQDNIKDDIDAINEKFMEKTDTDKKLILCSRPGKRNIYVLNREDFSWIKGEEEVR